MLGVPRAAPEEVVVGVEGATPGAGKVDVHGDYRLVFWFPPTGDELRAACYNIQE